MKKATLCTILILLVAVGVVWAQAGDAVLLRYKFQPGQVLKTVEVVKGNIPVEMDFAAPANMPGGGNMPENMTVNTEVQTTVIKILTVGSVDESGVATVTIKVEQMVVDTKTQVGNDAMTQHMEFQDGTLTTSGTAGQGLTPDKLQKLEEMLRKEYQAKVDPLGGVEPIGEDFEQIWQQAMGQGMAGVDYRAFTRSITGLPEQPVKVGDSWENMYEGGQTGDEVLGRSNMTLASISEEAGQQVAKITGNSYMKIENQQARPSDAPMFGSVMQGLMAKLDFLDMAMASELSLDLGLGQIVRSSADITMNMDQTMSLDLGKLLGGNQEAVLKIIVKIRDGKLHSEAATMVQ